MNLIACTDKNWGIGYKGSLLFRIPEDMKFFREMTIGHTVIMGRKTFESLPRKSPLPCRTNVVISSDANYKPEGTIVVRSPMEALRTCPDDSFIIGGGEIYRQMLMHCTSAYITRVHESAEADAFMPNLDLLPEWKKSEILKYCEWGDPKWEIARYDKVSI